MTDPGTGVSVAGGLLLALHQGLPWDLLKTAIGGIVSNRADASAWWALRAGRDWMLRLDGLPANHDVARAVRTAQMDALAWLITTYANPGGHAAHLTALTTPPFAAPALAYCEAEKARAQDRTFVLLRAGREATDQLTRAIDGVLGPPPQGDAAQARLAAVATAAEEAILAELHGALRAATPRPAVPPSVPAAFETLLRRGGKGEGGYVAVFGKFIADRIKTDDRFESIFTAGKLCEAVTQGAGIAVDVAAIRHTLNERFGGTLDEIRATLADLRVGQQELKQQLGTGLEAVHAHIDEMLGRLSARQGVPYATLAKLLECLGEMDVPDDQIERRLYLVANDYVALQERLTALSAANPDTAAARDEAAAQLEAGNLAGAEQLLDAAYQRELEAGEVRFRAAAAFRVDRAGVDRLQLRYAAAAAKYAEAAALVGFDSTLRVQYLDNQARALYSQGHEFGDNGALLAAIALWREVIHLHPRADAPLDWAAAQSSLGNALGVLGGREPATARLVEAIEAFRAALEEYTRARVPLDWAATQNSIGIALRVLGAREADASHLEEALEAYDEALQERTRERVPLAWAAPQKNRGNVLRVLGERDAGTERLEGATRAFRAALEVRTRAACPRHWAMTQNNLGVALGALGERDAGMTLLTSALEAYDEALQELTRERVPLAWAMTQNNRGTAIRLLGEREVGTAGTTRLEQAVATFEAALEEYTRARAPLAWAMTQNNLGLQGAVDCYRAALEERTRERVPIDWAITQHNLGSALGMLGQREHNCGHFEDAITALHSALLLFETAGADYYRARTASALADVQRSRDERKC